jgi:hypothetical protein
MKHWDAWKTGCDRCRISFAILCNPCWHDRLLVEWRKEGQENLTVNVLNCGDLAGHKMTDLIYRVAALARTRTKRVNRLRMLQLT